MNNYHFMKQATREELIDVINLLINEGSQLIPDELWEATHVVDHGNNRDEVDAWLMLDTLEKYQNSSDKPYADSV